MASKLLIFGALIFAIYLLRNRYSRGLNKFPGPFLASFTDVWKVWYAYNNSQNPHYVALHRKYGDIVRIGPNDLSFANPSAVRDIYGLAPSLKKSDVYKVPTMPVNGEMIEALFTGTDPQWHDRQRRLLSHPFSMTQMVQYEPWVDDSTALFVKQIRQRLCDQEPNRSPINLMEWFRYFSLDAVNEITFGEKAGFLESGSDINGTIAGVKGMMTWWLYLTRVPSFDAFFLKNRLQLWLSKYDFFKPPNPFMSIVQRQFIERMGHWQSTKGRRVDRDTLTDKFLTAQRENPQVADFQPFMHSMSVIGAAGESTAIALSSIFYYVLRNSQCYAKVKQEIDSHFPDPAIPIRFSEAQKLPYLDAVINEAMRCHWSTRMPMTRVTPETGLTVDGTFVPAKVNVGVSGTVLHRRKEVFGDDVETFRPERWLGNEEKVRVMRNTLFTFSRGKYNCLGQHLSKLEMYKFVPSVLRAFDMKLVNPDKDWTLENGPFAIPADVNVWVSAIGV